MATENKFYLNGIDATTGQYTVAPMEMDQLAAMVKGVKQDDAQTSWLKRVLRKVGLRHYGLPEGVNPADVKQAGWGIVFLADEDPAVKDALRPPYLSPEQFRGEEADLRSDIYSIGAIAYEMLGGQPPFVAKRVGEFGVKLLNARPQSLRQLNPDVNIVIEAEILRALEKDSLNRQQRALEFKRELLNGANLS